MSEPPVHASVERRAPPRRRRWLFAAVLLLLVLGAIELGSAIAWWAATGTMFSWAGAGQARREALAPTAAIPGAADARAAQNVMNGGVVVHPFFGYVDDASVGVRSGFPISRWGFAGTAPPLRAKSDDAWVVGVTGASVAMLLTLYAGDALANALARSPALAGRRIDLVPLGCGGYKQPQQLFVVQTMLLLGGHFDCIVNVDGFNEVALVEENVPLGVPAWYPRSWARLLDAVPTAEQHRRLGLSVLLAEQRADMVAVAETLWWSPTAQFVWRARDRALVQRQAALRVEIERAAAAPSAAVTGPGTGGRTVDEARGDMIAVWQRASRQLHALCEQHGIRYCHVLQPNQYVADSKPIGPDEAEVALKPDEPYARGATAGYPLLQRAGAELRDSGVPFTDLTAIFREHPEPLYWDACCHFNLAGNVILAEHVAAAVRRQLEPGIGALRSLRVPPKLALTSPLSVPRLVVKGVDADGREHDVSGEGSGTRLVALAEDRLAVGADGAVRAKYRGATRLRVVHGGLTAEVDVDASWPDLVDGGDAKSGPGGERPDLRIVGGGSNGDPAAMTLQCTGLPLDGMRILVAAGKPLPAEPQLVSEAEGVHVVPLDGAAAAPTATLPVQAPAGRAVFLRAFVIGAGTGAVLAASNTLVVTRG